MTHAAETALTILRALREARAAGQSPHAIILDGATQADLRKLHIGCWSASPATWSLFGVPVVTGLAPGWWLRLASERDAAAA